MIQLLFLYKLVHYLTAFIIGIVLMGANTQRTLQAYEGRIINSVISTILGSIMLWYGTQYINNNDCVSYGAYSAGCAFVTVYIANSYRQQRSHRLSG